VLVFLLLISGIERILSILERQERARSGMIRSKQTQVMVCSASKGHSACSANSSLSIFFHGFTFLRFFFFFYL
jgi:hypothetical protein